MEEVLSPGVQYGKEADLGTEVFGVGCNGAERFRGGTKKDRVDDFLVLEGDGGDLLRDGKDNVVVGNRQELSHARFKPFGSSQGLAFRAAPVAAGVVEVPLMGTQVTLIHMAAKNGGPADFDGAHGAMLLSGHRSAVQLPILRAILPEDVGHFHLWPDHWERLGSGMPGSKSNGLDV